MNLPLRQGWGRRTGDREWGWVTVGEVREFGVVGWSWVEVDELGGVDW